jgi:hypothetical protein
MRDLNTLIAQLREEGQFVDVASNPLSQFGTSARRYIGAEILPERTVPQNMFREDAIRYRTVVANDGTRYSPVQKKKGEFVGSFAVELGESDIGREITSREYDALIDLLGNRGDMQAMARILDWSDVTLNRAMLEHNERQRWQAIVAAVVQRRGDNGYVEDVAYSNPSGHRVNAGVVWSNDANDPMESDILPIVDMLAGKGFTVRRIVTSRPVISILAGNAKMQARIGSTVINLGGTLSIANQRANLDALNRIFQANDLPPLEEYNLQYRTQTASGYFLARNVMTFICETDRDEMLDFADEEQIVQSTLGYVGVGRAAGQSSPGRVLRLEAFTNKPPRVEGEGWETSLPVITEPEAIGVIGAIS